ncbi:DUF1967 domain-containing protein [Mycoplasma nasistruthionis]
MGVWKDLVERGIQVGDVVTIYGFEFEWTNEN